MRGPFPVIIALFAASLGGSASSQDGAPAAAVLTIEPSQVEVGEPLELMLELGEVAAFEAGTPDVDDSWVVLSESSEPTSGGVRFIWTVASLEPGDRLLGLVPGDDLADAPEPVRVRVRSVLGENEIEPRPIRGLPENFGRALAPASERSPLVLVLAGVLIGAVLVLLGALVRRRLRKPESVPAELGRLGRLDELTRSQADATTRHHVWAQLVREGVDARTDRPRAALVDEEWLAEVAREPSLDADLHARVAATLATCARVRFGGEAPSSYAMAETERQVRGILDELEGPRPASDQGRAA